jgi:hypothetical protein
MEDIMKTMTCKELGGACDQKFQANTFDEIAELSKAHGMQMYQKQDAAHLEAMNKMSELMKQPQAMQSWFEAKKKTFEALAED